MTRREARAKAVVTRGAAWLDEVRPGWFTQIDVGTLTLHDPCGCIVGQLCGLRGLRGDAYGEPFARAERWLFGTHRMGVQCGVSLNGRGGKRAYQPLQDAWIAAIADRWLSQAAVTSPNADSAEIQEVGTR